MSRLTPLADDALPAQAASQTPSAVTDADMDRLKAHAAHLTAGVHGGGGRD